MAERIIVWSETAKLELKIFSNILILEIKANYIH